jgi:hypothetical protein
MKKWKSPRTAARKTLKFSEKRTVRRAGTARRRD